ncbi:MAG: hypothetical protein SAK29_29990, partial [Scytonema sp. PMC 1069.18]|nr:hypothetical protein [Scytonema sp. PMC 1069.18]
IRKYITICKIYIIASFFISQNVSAQSSARQLLSQLSVLYTLSSQHLSYQLRANSLWLIDPNHIKYLVYFCAKYNWVTAFDHMQG